MKFLGNDLNVKGQFKKEKRDKLDKLWGTQGGFVLRLTNPDKNVEFVLNPKHLLDKSSDHRKGRAFKRLVNSYVEQHPGSALAYF